MYATDTILTFGFPCGQVAGVKFRVSVLYVFVWLGLVWRFDDLLTGTLATAILLGSVLLHEVSHLLAARASGGDMDEISMWPLGGLSEPFGRGYLQDHVYTMMAGPITNLLVCCFCLTSMEWADALPLLNPLKLTLPPTELISTTALKLTFTINSLLLVVNLIPVAPFDMGVVMRTWLTTRFTDGESRDLMIRLGLVAAIFGLITGFVLDVSAVLAVAAFVLVLQINEGMRWQEVWMNDTSEPAYDFETDPDDIADFLRPPEDDFAELAIGEDRSDWGFEDSNEGVEDHAQRQQEDAQVDALLTKLHDGGRAALTDDELQQLQAFSDRYRERREPSA